MAIRVFLADDHAVVREGLRLLLETQKDISVAGEAADGRKAVHEVKRLCPDVVIMDIAMPELNGIDATRQIRDHCHSTRIIILSMYASNEHIFHAFKAGAKGYLLKESAGAEVINAVRTVYAGHRYLSQNITETIIDDYICERDTTVVHSPIERLTSREREILQLVVEGKSSSEIAEVLSLSVKTVETYRCRFMEKLNIKDIPGLVKFALQHGLTTIK
jgi:DNA-binding NarL/FixJ family response regulator